MKCPDCGTILSGVPVEAGVLMRCFKCGGFWADSLVLNKLTAKVIEGWRRISVSSSWLSGGKGVCPADGMQLAKYSGESIPRSLSVSRCTRCGKWWFPGESLFSYKPAAEAKVSYFRLWGLASDTQSLLLPVMTVVVLLVTAWFGVSSVQKQQLMQVGAGSGVGSVAITYAGDGKAVLAFKAEDKIETVAYKGGTDLMWKRAQVVEDNGVYTVSLSGMVEGGDYYFLIGGREYKFTVR